jgi:hypothetical protein
MYQSTDRFPGTLIWTFSEKARFLVFLPFAFFLGRFCLGMDRYIPTYVHMRYIPALTMYVCMYVCVYIYVINHYTSECFRRSAELLARMSVVEIDGGAGVFFGPALPPRFRWVGLAERSLLHRTSVL